MNILYVNACVRKNSRTNLLAQYLLNKFNQPIDEIVLNEENIKPLNQLTLLKRDDLIANQEFDDPMFKHAKQFANADKIVIAAPYWDLSYPALLKVYFENINVSQITFQYVNNKPQSMCKAKELIYITTSGGQIFYDELGFGYIENLCKIFYGITDIKYIKAENLDIINTDVNSILDKAKKEIDELIV